MLIKTNVCGGPKYSEGGGACAGTDLTQVRF